MIASVFEAAGGELIDPPTLMDASVPLELSGEAVRARLCLFTDHEGRERALRPDLTLPVAKQEASRLINGGTGARRYRYNARAYRLPSAQGQPLEFTQIGTEVFGETASPQADADLFALVSRAAQTGGTTVAKAWFGDLSVFPAFVDGLELADAARGALKRAFRQAGGVSALLDGESSDAKTGLAAQLSGASWDEAESIVRDVLGVSGIEPIGTRSLEEIVAGLMAKAASAAAGGIPPEAASVLKDVLSVEASPSAAVEQLSKIAHTAGLKHTDDALQNLQVRIDKIKELAPDYLGDATFGTPFGRRFNYYDGFVFELFAPGAPSSAPFAAGGRYDSLIEKLSDGAASTTGIGGVVRPDRMEIGT